MASLENIEKDAFQLPRHERAILARNLIRSLENENTNDDADTDAIWIEEADRRYQELKEGKVKGIPEDQVFEEIESRFL